jgi:hypothetical protein
MIRCLNSGRGKRSFCSPKCADQLWDPPSLLFDGYEVRSYSLSGWGMKLTTCVHLVLRLRMHGAVPLLPMYAFIAWTGTSLLQTLIRTLLFRLKLNSRKYKVLMFRILVFMVTPYKIIVSFMEGSTELGWDHLGGESASVHSPDIAQITGSVSLMWSETLLQSFNAFISKKCFYVIKNKLFCFLRLLLYFCYCYFLISY